MPRLMVRDADDRPQLVAGLVFVVVLTVVWTAIAVLANAVVGLVVASMLATVATASYIGYVRFRAREQEYKERYEEHRYRASKAREDLERFADESGIGDAVAEIGPRIADATERLRDRRGGRRDADEREDEDDV